MGYYHASSQFLHSSIVLHYAMRLGECSLRIGMELMLEHSRERSRSQFIRGRFVNIVVTRGRQAGYLVKCTIKHQPFFCPHRTSMEVASQSCADWLTTTSCVFFGCRKGIRCHVTYANAFKPRNAGTLGNTRENNTVARPSLHSPQLCRIVAVLRPNTARIYVTGSMHVGGCLLRQSQGARTSYLT
jgi:hypothetical protein